MIRDRFRLVCRAAACLTVASAAGPASAAEVTDVADAADTIIVGDAERDDPFDMYFGGDLQLSFAKGKITREAIDRPGLSGGGCSAEHPRDCLPVDEARWTRNTVHTLAKMQIGLFHDLALTGELPIYHSDMLCFRYASGVGPQNSTIDPQSGDPNDTLFPLRSYIDDKNTYCAKHGGIGDLRLGLRFGVLNDERDDSKPAWVVYFKWGMPYTAETYDPADQDSRASRSKAGSMGDGTHRLTFGTALSKRIGRLGLIGIDPNANRRGYTDPYMEFSYTLPIPQRDRAPEPLVKTAFAHPPPHIARLNAGFEVVPYEDLRNMRRVAIDIGFRGQFCTEGRSSFGPSEYCGNQLVDPLHRLLFTEQFMSAQGVLALNVQAAQYVHFNIGVGFGYITEHFLTYENVGKDVDGDNQVIAGTPSAPSDDQPNPYFCGFGDPATDICAEKGQPSIDQVGYRFKDEEHSFINVLFGLQITL